LEFIVILKIQPFVIFFVFLIALGFSQAWQNDYKDQLPFIPPKALQLQAKSAQV
jgi:hypothetical protein